MYVCVCVGGGGGGGGGGVRERNSGKLVMMEHQKCHCPVP